MVARGKTEDQETGCSLTATELETDNKKKAGKSKHGEIKELTSK